MTAPQPIPAKVRRLVPMFGSTVDGEALSACRAVGRVLGRAGLSYIDLAQAIPVEGEAATAPPAGPIPGWDDAAWHRAARPRRRKVYTFTPAQNAVHRRQALYCRNHDRGRLSERERTFVADIAHRRGELSVKQADWLAVLCDRLEWEDRTPC